MINVTDTIKQAYEKSTTQYDKIVLNNQEYVVNNVELDDDCYENGNVFGTAIAKSLSFEIDSSVDLEGKEFVYYTGIKTTAGIEWIKLGTFITQDVEPNDTNKINKVNALDYMLKTNIEYNTTLQYQNNNITLLQVAQEASTKTGLILATTDFPNSNFIVDSNQFEQGTLIRQVIQAIAQVSGTVAKVRSDDKLYFITPKTTGTVRKVFNLSDYAEVEIKRATHPINLVCLGMSDIEGENVVKRDEESIQENGENSLIINDNPFAYTEEKRNQLITAIFNAVKGFEYKAFTLKGQWLPYLETLDNVQVKDLENNTYNSFIFRCYGKSPNGLETEMSAPSLTDATVEYQNLASAEQIAKRTEYRVDKAEGTIRQVVEEIGDRSERSTTVTQDIDQLRVAVAEVTDMSRETTGSDTMHITDTVDGNGYVLNLTLFGSTENMYYVTPEENLVPSNDLVPNGGYVTIVCDSTGRLTPSENAYKYKIKLDKPLRDLGDVKDELNISNNGTVTVTRRLGTTGGVNGQVYVLDEEVTETIENITITSPNGTEKSTKAILHTFEDETYIYTKEFRYLNFEIKYITQSDYSEQFITKVDFQSSLTVAVDEILSTVSATYVSDTELNNLEASLESQISQTATSILSTVSANYATKTALEDTETTLQSSISQTSTSILSTVSSTYATKSSLNSTKTELQTSINQKADSVTVSATYATKSSLNSVNNNLTASLELKVNTEDLISEINASADQIKLTAGRLIITSGNFKLDANGNVTASNMNITGGRITLSSSGTDDTRISVQEGSNSNNKVGIESGRVYITRYGTNYAYMGITEYVNTGGRGGIIDLSDTSGNMTFLQASGIETPKLTQTSLATRKKNFEKMKDVALGIIKEIDIYKYNLKDEKDTDKKHLGFLIGNKYKYSKEVTSNDNTGVDNYSFTSLCCKAIQELTKRVEKLEGSE